MLGGGDADARGALRPGILQFGDVDALRLGVDPAGLPSRPDHVKLPAVFEDVGVDGPVVVRIGLDPSAHREGPFAGVLLRIFEHIYLMVVRIAVVGAQIDIPFLPDVYDLGMPDVQQPVLILGLTGRAGLGLLQLRGVCADEQVQLPGVVGHIIIESFVEIDRRIFVFADDGVFEDVVPGRLLSRARDAQDEQQGGDRQVRDPAQRHGVYGSFHGWVGFKILIYEYKFRKLNFFTCHILIRKRRDLVKMPRRGPVGGKLSSIGQILVPRNG